MDELPEPHEVHTTVTVQIDDEESTVRFVNRAGGNTLDVSIIYASFFVHELVQLNLNEEKMNKTKMMMIQLTVELHSRCIFCLVTLKAK